MGKSHAGEKKVIATSGLGRARPVIVETRPSHRAGYARQELRRNYVLMMFCFGRYLPKPGGTPDDGFRRKGQTACKPGSVPAEAGDGHSSGTPVAGRLARPTRAAARKHACGAGPLAAPIRSCSRWGLPCRSRCRERGALLPHPFTLARRPETRRPGGLLSVALSRGSPPPGVTRHRVSVEPGLSSLPARTGRAAIRPSGGRESGSSAASGQFLSSATARRAHSRRNRPSVSSSIRPSMRWGRKWRWKATTLWTSGAPPPRPR